MPRFLATLAPLALAVLTACEGGAEDPQAPTASPLSQPDAAEPAPSPPTPEAITPVDQAPSLGVEELEGEYRVAGIDEEPFDEPFGIALSIRDGHLFYEPRCAGFDWTITDSGNGRLDLARVRSAAPAPGEPPAPVCAVAVHPAQSRLGQALDAVDHAARTQSNGIALTSGGRSVTLYSQ